LLKPKGEFGIGFLDESLPLRMDSRDGDVIPLDSGDEKSVVPHRSCSLMLDAAAYVLTLDVLMKHLAP